MVVYFVNDSTYSLSMYIVQVFHGHEIQEMDINEHKIMQIVR